MKLVVDRMVVSFDHGNLRSGRHTPNTPSSEASSVLTSTENVDTIIEIAAHGDIILRVEHQINTERASRSFRVSSSLLKIHSKYFERLLQPGRFGEAVNIERKLQLVREQYRDIAQAPSTELPVLDIQDLGRISVKSIDSLLSDCLCIMHGKDTQTNPPVANLANLAVVADRFDALEVVKNYVRRKKMIRALDGRTTSKIDSGLSEEKVRQRLLVGLLLDYPPWVEKYSVRLITKGWVGKEAEISIPQWWDIPSRVEEELAYRRECILETIQSLQSYFLGLYTSRDRNCKLGYDSSTQCDSFQLGEMVRFFTRIGTLQFQGTIVDSNAPPTAYAADLNVLLDTLRQVPEYQIDKFHTHCGIRTRIIPLLDFLQEAIQFVWICPDCWQQDRLEYAWIANKRPLLWKKKDFRWNAQGHSNRHADIRALFTATEKDWGS